MTYLPDDLSRYEGEPFCLRITPEDIDLERCFFVYLDATFEDSSLRRLFQTYFIAPKPDHVDEMESWLEPWLRVDPMLPKKYALLRQMIAKVHARSGRIQFYINHGPGPVNTEDTVSRPSRDQRGSADDGSFDDKILDIVRRVPRRRGTPPRARSVGEVRPDRHRGRKDRADPARVWRRRFLSRMVMVLIAFFTLPLLLFSCRGNNNGSSGGGFGGGML